MMRRLLYRLTAGLPCRLISRDGAPYLERYYVGKLFGFTAYLHRFVDSDGDKEVHDHPWHISMAFVLAGSYREERLTCFDLLAGGWCHRMRRIDWFNWIPGHVFHRIADAEPETWTLFIHHGGRRKGWGFLKLEHRMQAVDATRSACRPVVVYHQPFDAKASEGWIQNAHKGRDAGRAPMGASS